MTMTRSDSRNWKTIKKWQTLSREPCVQGRSFDAQVSRPDGTLFTEEIKTLTQQAFWDADSASGFADSDIASS